MIAKDLARFPAQLKSEEGELLADGTATVLLPQQAVTFCSDFVPLFPLGTNMQIIRVENGLSVHRFSGRVYLSDKQLMRLVDVQDELLPGSENIYCGNMPFSASFALRRPHSLFSFGKKKVQPGDIFDAPITELTDSRFVFLYDNQHLFELGTRFNLQAHSPLPLPPVTVELTESFLFGENASHLCRFVDLSDDARQTLHRFLEAYNLAHNKLF